MKNTSIVITEYKLMMKKINKQEKPRIKSKYCSFDHGFH